MEIEFSKGWFFVSDCPKKHLDFTVPQAVALFIYVKLQNFLGFFFSQTGIFSLFLCMRIFGEEQRSCDGRGGVAAANFACQ